MQRMRGLAMNSTDKAVHCSQKRSGPLSARDCPGIVLRFPGILFIKSLLMPLFLMGCFPVDFQDVKRPLRTKSVKRPIKVGKRPINEGKRPIKAKVLVGVSVGSLMGCFRAPPPWRKTAPLKRPIKRSMGLCVSFFSTRETQHINNFDSHPFPGQSRKFLWSPHLTCFKPKVFRWGWGRRGRSG